MDAFRKFHSGPDKSVLCIWGPGGLGKSTLMAKCMAYCVDVQSTVLELSATSTHQLDGLAIMSSLAAQLGDQYFTSFQSAYTDFWQAPVANVNVTLNTSSQIKVAENLRVDQRSSVGHISGIN